MSLILLVLKVGTAMSCDPFAFPPPVTRHDEVSFAAACGYEWSYLDTMRYVGLPAEPVPDGWAFAWVEYRRRDANPLGMRAAFRYWLSHASLPGLS